MEKNTTRPKLGSLAINYGALGTVNSEEFCQALIEDMKAIQALFGVRYVTGAKLSLTITNEYGERVPVRRPEGNRVFMIDTFYYRPACKDFDL